MKKKTFSVWQTVMVLCLLVTLAMEFVPLANESEKAILAGAYYKPMILAGEWWRFLTAGFVHAGLLHLTVNCMSLSMLGAALEHSVGPKKFLIILLVSVIGGCAFLFAAGGNVIAMGLSGGLYGLLACYTWILVRMGAMKNKEVRTRMFTMYLINILINLMPSVSALGHAGGFVTGLLLSGLLLADRKEQKRRHYAAAAVILAGSLCFLGMKNAYIPETERYPGSDLNILAVEKKYGLESYAYKVAERLDRLYDMNGVLSAALKEK